MTAFWMRRFAPAHPAAKEQAMSQIPLIFVPFRADPFRQNRSRFEKFQARLAGSTGRAVGTVVTWLAGICFRGWGAGVEFIRERSVTST